MDPNFTPGSDEHEQQLFQEQQDFLYSVLISYLKTEFSEALVKDHERDAQLILELLHEHHLHQIPGSDSSLLHSQLRHL